MARTKDEHLHAQRRLQILQAASQEFKAKGFHGARTEDICAGAGLSAGTVFRYFASKEDIISTIAELEIEAYRNWIKLLATKEGLLWMARLDAQGLAELLAPTQFDLGADSWLELYRHPQYRDRMIEQDQALRASFAAALRAGQRDGWIRSELEASGAVNIISAVFSGLMFDQQTNQKLGLAATAAAIADLFRCFILQQKDGKP